MQRDKYNHTFVKTLDEFDITNEDIRTWLTAGVNIISGSLFIGYTFYQGYIDRQ
jgi:hypothetical protein